MDIWFEKAAEYSGRATDPLWAEPNTFPMFRLDIRDLSATGAGTALVAMVVSFFTDVAAIWPAGKAKKWVLLLVGPDGSDGGILKMGVIAHPGDYLPLQVDYSGPKDRVGIYHDTALELQGVTLLEA